MSTIVSGLQTHHGTNGHPPDDTSRHGTEPPTEMPCPAADDRPAFDPGTTPPAPVSPSPAPDCPSDTTVQPLTGADSSVEPPEPARDNEDPPGPSLGTVPISLTVIPRVKGEAMLVSETLTLDQVAEFVRNDPALREETGKLRAMMESGADDADLSNAKKRLKCAIFPISAPAGTPVMGGAGVPTSQHQSALASAHHSALYPFDLDKGGLDPDAVKRVLTETPGIVLAGKSARGKGLWVIARGPRAASYEDHTANHSSIMAGFPACVRDAKDAGSVNVNRLRFLSSDPDLFYNPRAEMSVMADVPAPAAPIHAGPVALSASLPLTDAARVRLASTLENHPKFRRTWEGNRPDLHDQSRSGFDFSLAVLAAQGGWEADGIHRLLVERRRVAVEEGRETPKFAGERYFTRTVGRAMARVAAENAAYWDADEEGWDEDGEYDAETTDSASQEDTQGSVSGVLEGQPDPQTAAAPKAPGKGKSKGGEKGRPKSKLRLTVEELEAAGWFVGGGDKTKFLERGSALNAGLAIEKAGETSRFAFNEWTRSLEVDGVPPERLAKEISRLKAKVEGIFRHVQYMPTKAALEEAIHGLEAKNRYNPVLQRIRSQPWDGTDRLIRYGTIVYGADWDDELTNAVAALIPRGMVVRALFPGATFPYMPIIRSDEQGPGKGDSLRYSAPGQYIEGIDLRGFDYQRKLQERARGKSVIEFSEMSSLRGTELERAKAIITANELFNREAFQEDAIERLLTAIIVATTNAKYFLTDNSHRRNPVVEVPQGFAIDLEWVLKNREQVWAQVAHEYDQGLFHEYGGGVETQVAVRLPPHLWVEANDASREYEEEDELGVWLAANLEWVVGWESGDALRKRVRAAHIRTNNQQFGEEMTKHGWQKRQTYGGPETDGKRMRIWELPGKGPK